MGDKRKETKVLPHKFKSILIIITDRGERLNRFVLLPKCIDIAILPPNQASRKMALIWCKQPDWHFGKKHRKPERFFIHKKKKLRVMRSKFTQPSSKETCPHHPSISRPSGYQGQGGRLWNSLLQWVCSGFTVCRRVSKCHSHILSALFLPSATLPLLQCISVLTFTKLASVRLNSCNKSF